MQVLREKEVTFDEKKVVLGGSFVLLKVIFGHKLVLYLGTVGHIAGLDLSGSRYWS